MPNWSHQSRVGDQHFSQDSSRPTWEGKEVVLQNFISPEQTTPNTNTHRCFVCGMSVRVEVMFSFCPNAWLGKRNSRLVKVLIRGRNGGPDWAHRRQRWATVLHPLPKAHIIPACPRLHFRHSSLSGSPTTHLATQVNSRPQCAARDVYLFHGFTDECDEQQLHTQARHQCKFVCTLGSGTCYTSL